MPISDAYVVQYLLQATGAAQDPIVWKAKESEGFVATVRGVQVDVDRINTTTSSYLCLSLSRDEETIYITEPMRAGIIRPSYKTEDQHQLACLIRHLAQAIAQQCAVRQNSRTRGIEVTRQTMYQRLIGTSGSEG